MTNSEAESFTTNSIAELLGQKNGPDGSIFLRKNPTESELPNDPEELQKLRLALMLGRVDGLRAMTEEAYRELCDKVEERWRSLGDLGIKAV